MSKTVFGLVFLLFILVISAIPVHASSVNGVIFRANVNEMYIENQPIPVQVQALYFQDSVPQSTTIIVAVTVQNLTSGGSYSAQFNVSSGVPQFIYLRSLPVGEYSFQAYASALGQTSQQFNEQFIVAPPPVPYYAAFTAGGVFTFHSDMLNRTGHYNVNFTFTIDVYYQYPGGAAEEVGSYQNVTNLTTTFPDEGQIVVINIIDRYGWLNGMNINPSEGIFSGFPYDYNFNIQNQAPFTSVYAGNFIADAMAIAIIILLMLYIYNRRLKG